MLTLSTLIAEKRGQVAAKLSERNRKTEEIAALRGLDETEENVAKLATLRADKDALDAELRALGEKIAEYEAEQARDDEAARLADVTVRTETRAPAYDQVARVGAEKRTYNPDADKAGGSFLRDVGLQLLGDFAAGDRLSRHMAEERVERADFFARAAGTGAFAGLTVPQYLTDMYAPAAKANRPFAEACNKHALPSDGMVVNLSRITTGTSAALQASENTGVSETNIDDTLLSIPVQTVAGQQTLSRQAIERGTGVEDAMMDDLFRSYHTALDSTLLNQATTGLSAISGAMATYVDATPTVAELYPKFAQALSLVEAALLDQDANDQIAVMHSRRWYWLQNAVGSSWPFAQQPGIPAQMGIVNLAESYGPGVRGVLPNGVPVIVDNNVTTAAGAGTEDEIYIANRRECHLWEDPSAPVMIRAEQTAAGSLGVLFVAYGYFAYTFGRYSGGTQKISGTGLIAPTFGGV